MVGLSPDEGYQVLAAVLRYQRPLVAYAASLIGDVERARDLVQETFLRLCAHGDVAREEHLAPWLFKVCRNLAIDAQRREQRALAKDEAAWRTEVPAMDIVELRKDSATVMSLFVTLPPNQREVLRLKFLHDLSYREISDITELSVSNVGYLIHVGLKAIRDKLALAPRAVVEK